MKLTDKTLMEWANAGAKHYAQENYPDVDGITRRDIELASDVSTFMPMLYLVPRYFMGFNQNSLNPVYVEIGTADGSSAIPILKAAQETNGHLHSLDPSDCEDAHRLVKQFEYEKYWTHHQMPSDDFFKTYNGYIDFAFIDGDHRWPVVERDIKNCFERLRPGGMIWVSDYGVLREGYPSYEHEYDGPDFTPHISSNGIGPASLSEQQLSDGVAKALYRILPTLERAQSTFLSVWPNPSVLVRKMEDGELDPLKKNIFGGM